MLDSQLLAAAIQSRSAWERIAPHFKAEEFSPLSKFWFLLIQEWYTRDPQASGIDKTLLVEQGKKRITNKKHMDALLGFMNDLQKAPSADNVATVALEMKRHGVGMQLAAAIASQDDKKVAELLPLYTELKQATSLQKAIRATIEQAVDWDQLDEIVGKGKRIALAPNKLTERTNGGALPGHSILIFGRSDAGKTTFALNMTAGFLQNEHKTLYVGNEESINVLKARMRNRLANMTPEEVEKDPKKANSLSRKRSAGLLEMHHLHNGSMDGVRRLLDEVEPEVIILDQLRGMSVAAGEKMTQKLEQVAIEWRSVLSTYGVVGVTLTQANDRTSKPGEEQPLWLSQSDIDSSRTGVPGAMDLIVAVAVNNELMQRGQRAISIAKSKLSSKPDAKEGFIVEMDVARCRVKS